MIKRKIPFLLCSAALGLLLIGCSKKTTKKDTTKKPNVTTGSKTTDNTTTKKTTQKQTTTKETTTENKVLCTGFKVFLRGEEYSSENNSLDYFFGEDYFKDIVVKAIYDDGTTKKVTNYTIDTTINEKTGVGDYTAVIKYLDFDGVTINVTIKASEGSVTNFKVANKIYDGKKPVVNYETNSDGEVTIQYKNYAALDETYTNEAPTAVGAYNCRIEISATENCSAVSETCTFIITKKGIKPLESGEYDDKVYQNIATGSELELDIPGFDSNFMKLLKYDNEAEDYVEVNSLKATTGNTLFRIALKDDNTYFEGSDESVRYLDYSWQILDPTSFITKIVYKDKEISLQELIDTPLEIGSSVSFTTVSGYSAYLADYYNYSMSAVQEGKYMYVLIKQGSNIIYRHELKKACSCLDTVTINGTVYAVGSEDIYYYTSSEEKEIKLVFSEAKADFLLETGGYDRLENPTEYTVKNANKRLQLWRVIDEGSSQKICNIYIVAEDPIKSMSAIKYDIKTGNIFTQAVNFDGDYYTVYGSDNTFDLGLDISLNEGYEDCTVRILDRDTQKEFDFKNIKEYVGEYIYYVVEISRGGKVIDKKNVESRFNVIKLNGSETYFYNRGTACSMLRESLDSENKLDVNFSLFNEGVSAYLYLEGEDHAKRTYTQEGVYLEHLCYAAEIYGEYYRFNLECIVIVNMDSRDIGRFQLTYHEEYNPSSNYLTTIYNAHDYSHHGYNAFYNDLESYSIDHINVSSDLRLDESQYTITSAELINDEEKKITYFKVIVNRDSTTKTIYLFVGTDSTLTYSLDIEKNRFRGYDAYGNYTVYQVENDTINITNATCGSYYYVDFVSKAKITIISPDNKTKDLGTDDEIYDLTFDEEGTYYLEVENSKGKKTYTINVSGDFRDLCDISIGNDPNRTVLYYRTYNDNNLSISSKTSTIKGYLGDVISLIRNGKATLNVDGLLVDRAYTDIDLTNKITGDNVTLDVLYDEENKPYVVIYADVAMFEEDGMTTLVIYLCEKPKADLALIFGDSEYQIGNDDDPLDLTEMSWFGYYLSVNEPYNTFTLSVNKVYDDYTNALVFLPFMSESGFTSCSIGYLEQNEYVYRVTNAETLTLTASLSKDYYYPYTVLVLPQGTTDEDILGDLNYFSFILDKPAYIFDITVGKNDYYATVSTNMNNGEPMFDTNASDIETEDNAYSDLVFYLGKEEKKNIIANRYKFMITSELGIAGSLYTMDDSVLCPQDGEVELPVQEDDGVYYVQFYYDADYIDCGSAVITLILDDEPAE